MQNIDIESLTESERHELLVKLFKENVDIEGLKEITSIKNNRIIWCDDKRHKCNICGSKFLNCKEEAHNQTIKHQKALKLNLKRYQVEEFKEKTNNEQSTNTTITF